MTYDIKPICDVVVFSNNHLAMVDYNIGPDNQTGWYLPNDLLENCEDPLDAARRIVKNHFSAECKFLRLAYTESFTGNDGTWHLAFHYACHIDNRELANNEFIKKVSWFDKDKLPNSDQVAHHGWYKIIAQRIVDEI